MTVTVLHARATDQRTLDFADNQNPSVSVTSTTTEKEALDTLVSSAFDCVVIDQQLDAGTGLSLLSELRVERPSIPVVFCTDAPDGTVASEATRYGISAYHVHDADEPLERRVREVLSEQLGSADSPPPIVSDGAATTHGTVFRGIAETVREAIVTIDSDRYVQFANDGATELTGYTREELVGEPFAKLLPDRLQKPHCDPAQQYLEADEQNANSEYFESVIEHVNGDEIPVAVSFREFERDGQRLFTGVIRDISDRQSQAHALKQLHKVASDPSLSHLERVEQVLEDYRRRLGVSMAFFSHIEDETEELVVATGDHELATEGLTVPLEETYCQYAMEADEPLVVTDAESSDTIPTDIYDTLGLSCYLGETVTVDGETYGTICFADDRTATSEFDEQELAFLEVLADWVGYELTQKIQYEQIGRERGRVEQILERVDDAFFAVDDDWKFTYFNARAEEVLGRSREEVLGKSVWECFPEAVDSTFDRQYRRAMRTQEPVVFDEYYPPLETWFQVSAYPDEDGLSVYFSDITDSKEYTEALRKLHDQTQDLVTATTQTEIAEIVLDATTEILGHDFCGVRLVEGDWLHPVATSDPALEMTGKQAVYDADCWGPGDALQTQELVVITDPVEEATRTVTGPRPESIESFSELLFVPIGEHGTLGVGTQHEFDEADTTLAELLASHAAMAFDRIERESDLLTSQTVLETLQGMVYALDSDGGFELVTEPLAEWLGYDQVALLGSEPDRLFPEDERDHFWETIESISGGDTNHATIETEMLTAGGERLLAEIELSTPPEDSPFDGSIGVVYDRSKLEATREQLESERDRFQYLFDNLPDAVVEARIEDEQPIVESVNDSFEETFGYDETEITGKQLNDHILPSGKQEEAAEIDRSAAKGEYWAGEIRRKTAHGLRYFLFRGVPYTAADDIQRGFGIYTDITERKQRERRLQVLTRVLRHNLRNELTVLLGYAEMLQEDLDDDKLSRAARSIQTGIYNVSDLSEDARRIQRTLENEAPGGIRDLSTVVNNTLDTHSPDAIQTDVPSDLQIECDGRLQLALSHLLENAAEHTGDSPTVRIRGTRQGSDLVLTVEDDGPGIPDLEWNVVTGKTEITQLSHGSGLGLWAVKWVTESYGGRLERFETDLGGTGIRLYFPGIIVE